MSMIEVSSRRFTSAAFLALTFGLLLSKVVLLPGCSKDKGSNPPQQECSLTLTSPNGGEVWAVGDSASIAWTSEGSCGDQVRLELLHEGEACLMIVDSLRADGAYLWNAVAACGAESTGYAVRVLDLEGMHSDASDTTFTISPAPEPCGLAITYPDGGESILCGDPVTITWEITGTCTDSVLIELLHEGTACDTLAPSAPNTGSYAWVAAPCDSDTSGYAIRISAIGSEAVDVSGATFVLNPVPPPCQVTVIYPNGGETLQTGDLVAIIWEASEVCGSSVRLDLLFDGALCQTLADSVQNLGALAWTVTQCASQEEAGYTVRVTDRDSGQYDDSDAAFTIIDSSPQCELTVAHPNGGESFLDGDQVEIAWNVSEGCGESVMIELLRASAPCDTIAASVPNSGSYSWSATPCGADSSDYTIRISDLESEVSDQSDESFTIRMPLHCAVTVLAPSGGGTFCEGDTIEISWSVEGDCGDSVRVELLSSGSPCMVIAASWPNSGSYTWIAQECAGEEEGYQVRVTDVSSGNSGQSEDAFSILPGCDLIINNPAGGEAFCVGDTLHIDWTAGFCCGPEVLIELLLDEAVCRTIAPAAANTGTYAWACEQCGADSSGYTIRISDPATAASTESGSFVIRSCECVLAVTYPNGGEALQAGEAIAITWSASADCGGEVAIVLSREGSICDTISAAAANSGSYAWTPAQCDSDSAGYALCITDTESGTLDCSDGSFSIAGELPPCEISVTAPAGGESFCPGEAIEIDWQVLGCCGDSVTVELVRDGSVCATIAPSAQNSGSYGWVVSPCGSYTEEYRIRVTDRDTSSSGESAGWFSIEAACAIAVTNPSGGESFCSGEPLAITWDYSECCGSDVLIELLRNSLPCDTLSQAAVNDGSFEWTAAQCGGHSEGYKIRVTDNASGETDASDVSFAIQPACLPAVTYPDGGESFCEGDAVAIAWDYAECCGAQVTIELLRNGSVCETIASQTANDGSYPWSAGRCGSETEGYAIRVTDLDSGTAGESEATFEIDGPCTLEVTSPPGGALFHVGDPVTITWDPSACCGENVRIELLRAGGSCAVVDPSAANDGFYSWPAAQCGSHIEDYQIRVTDLDSEVQDEGPAFMILPTTTLLVCPDGTGDYETIQNAIDAASNGHTILLCDGTFAGPNNRDLDFGGRSITLRSLSEDATLCIINCGGTASIPHGAFRFHSGETTAASVEGITVTGGYNTEEFGGTIEISNASSPAFVDCIFTGNVADDGGGIGCYEASCPTFTNCQFLDNDGRGGATRCADEGTNPQFASCVFSENRIDGAVCISAHAAPAFDSCEFRDNSAGAVEVWNSTNFRTVFTNCTFESNAAWGGAAVYVVTGYSNLEFIGCSFTANVAGDGMGGAFVGAGGTVVEPLMFDGCDFTGNSAPYGGALSIWGSDREYKAVITDCTFSGNTVGAPGARGRLLPTSFTGRGGAVHSYESLLRIDGCTFSGNQGHNGGALALGDCVPDISMCEFSANLSANGGALYYEATSGSLSDCTFSGNDADSSGGAVHLYASSSPTISGCDFVDNQALYGGALRASQDCDPIFVSCTIAGNEADSDGGGLHCSDSCSPTLTDCLLYGNHAFERGGALSFCLSGIPQVSHCTICGNRADTAGGGISLNVFADIVIDASIISHSEAGEAIYCFSPANDVTLSCSDIYGNAGGDYEGCLSGMLGVDHNISADPVYCDLDNWDLRLDESTPCDDEAECGVMGAEPVGCSK